MKQIKQICIGLGISSTVYLIISLFFTTGQVQQNILLVLFFGIFTGLLSLVYESEKLSLITKTLIHLLGMLFAFYFVGLNAKWFELNFIQILIATIIFLVIFFIFYSYFYFKEKKEIEKINSKIKHN